MLQLRKNEAVTGIVKESIEVREMELSWYKNFYSVMAAQSAMIAGFGFNSLTLNIPSSCHWTVEVVFMTSAGGTIGFSLLSILCCTLLGMWGAGTALRGTAGPASIHYSVAFLEAQQKMMFVYYLLGWAFFFTSTLSQVWVFYPRTVAQVCTMPLFAILIMSVIFTYTITGTFVLMDDEKTDGRAKYLQPYDTIGDLDQGLRAPGQGPDLPAPHVPARERGLDPIQENLVSEATNHTHVDGPGRAPYSWLDGMR